METIFGLSFCSQPNIFQHSPLKLHNSSLKHYVIWIRTTPQACVNKQLCALELNDQDMNPYYA